MFKEHIKTIFGIIILLLIIIGVGLGVKHLMNEDPKPSFTFPVPQKAYIGEILNITWKFDKSYTGPIKLEFVNDRQRSVIFDGIKENQNFEWDPSLVLLNESGRLVITAGTQKDEADNSIRITKRFVSKPDLKISARFNNSVICMDTDNQIEVIVSNIGDKEATDFEVKLFPSANSNVTREEYVKLIESLQPDRERTLFFNVKYKQTNTTSSIKAKLRGDANSANNEKSLTARFSPMCSLGSVEIIFNPRDYLMPIQIKNGLLIDTIYIEPGKSVNIAKTQSTILNRNFINSNAMEEILLRKSIQLPRTIRNF